MIKKYKYNLNEKIEIINHISFDISLTSFENYFTKIVMVCSLFFANANNIALTAFSSKPGCFLRCIPINLYRSAANS